VRQGVKYVHRVHRGQFDWFMRIDDDGYVIMENLIMFLRTRDPTRPEMFTE
jgi:glycoprotein-N-acetylgalactosamine 3-beta-galactosyltransferase